MLSYHFKILSIFIPHYSYIFFLLLSLNAIYAKDKIIPNSYTDIGKNLNISISNGILFPGLNLNNYLSNGISFGARLSSPYYKNIHIQSDLFYSIIEQSSTNHNIHITKGGIGLFYKIPSSSLNFPNLSYPNIGLGLNSILIKRSISKKSNNDKHLLLDDYELEFGMYPFIHGVIPIFNLFFKKKYPFNIIYGGEWNITFSKPEWSHLFLILLGIQWNLW